MRAASPPWQIERENETIVISHHLFGWGKGVTGDRGYILFIGSHAFIGSAQAEGRKDGTSGRPPSRSGWGNP